MLIYAIRTEDATDKLSIASAMQKGYQVKVITDGCGVVVNGDGQVYNVHAFGCDCPDAANRDGGTYEHPDGTRFCKHVAYLSQVYPCECGGVMLLRSQEHWRYFTCSSCGTLKAFQAAKNEREQAKVTRRAQERAEIIKRGVEASNAVFA